MKKYRLVQLSESEDFLRLLLRSYAPIRAQGINFAAAKADLPLVQAHIQHHLCYVVEEDSRFIATISLRLPWGVQPGPDKYPHIGWFGVDPDYSGQGVGSELLNWLEKEILMKELKTPVVTLGTAATHPWLAKMYERKGFIQFAKKDLGRGHQTLFFKKDLTVPIDALSE